MIVGYITGLNSHIQEKVHSYRIHQVDEAYQLALRAEERIRMKSTRL